jgi:flavorubredoxin
MADDQKNDYLEPVELAKGLHWIGHHEKGVGFQCNPYVLVDGEEAIVFDPGNVLDYPKVASKLFSIVDPERISYIVIHHQDPDFCSSGPLLEDTITNKDLKIATHSFSSLFARYYGFKCPFYLVDRHQYVITFKSGNVLKFIHTPFCHSPGAFATYYEKERVLFTSDIFGSISARWSFFAEKNYTKDMRSFHIGYMASKRHLNMVMEQFEKLDIKLILPQHGSIIKEDMISTCIEFLKQLPCGIDAEDKKEAYNWVK